MTRPEAMERARSMYGDGRNGWTITELARYLERNGVSVSWWTVKKWVDPKYAAAERERQRVKARHALRRKRGTPIYRLRVLDEPALMDRLNDLRGVGLSPNAVRKVVNLDHRLDLSEDEVRDALSKGRVPQRFRGIETRRATA